MASPNVQRQLEVMRLKQAAILADSEILEATRAQLFCLQTEVADNSVKADLTAENAPATLINKTRSLSALDLAANAKAAQGARFTHGSTAARSDVEIQAQRKADALGLETNTARLAKAVAARGLFSNPRSTGSPSPAAVPKFTKQV